MQAGGQLVGLREEGLGGRWPEGHLELGVSGPGGQCLLQEPSGFFHTLCFHDIYRMVSICPQASLFC